MSRPLLSRLLEATTHRPHLRPVVAHLVFDEDATALVLLLRQLGLPASPREVLALLDAPGPLGPTARGWT